MASDRGAMSHAQHSGMAHPAARDQSHRRALLVSMATLILVSMSPVFGHHLATRADALLAGHDHLGNICLIALHVLLSPVHSAFHLLLWVGLAWAVSDRLRAWYALRRTLSALACTPVVTGDAFHTAARLVGLSADRIRVVDGLPNPAFTAGFWRPRVYVAAALPTVLDAAQLSAVMAHEAAHVARRDPLRHSVMRFLACTLFYVPALRRLADDLADESEIEADDAAVSDGDALVLASAILALAEWAVPSGVRKLRLGSAVAFQPLASPARDALLERRIRRLAGEPVGAGTHVTRRSLGAAGVTLIAVWTSGLMMAHPLPAEASGLVSSYPHGHATSHCRHHGASALSHLFCLGLHSHPGGEPCPHTGR